VVACSRSSAAGAVSHSATSCDRAGSRILRSSLS
jgi:hypothetical protein